MQYLNIANVTCQKSTASDYKVVICGSSLDTKLIVFTLIIKDNN